MGRSAYLNVEHTVDGKENGIKSNRLIREENEKESDLKWWIFGILFLTLSIATLILSPNTMYIRKKMILSNGGEVLNLWMTPNIDAIAKLYLFNITNKEGFLKGNEKLKLQEVGPFVYKFKGNYLNPVFNNEEGTVSIDPDYRVEWIPEWNNRSEEDVFTLVNMILLALANKQFDPFGIVKTTLNEMFRQIRREPIEDMSVKTFLFGEDLSYLKFLSTLIPALKHDRYGLLTLVLDHKGESQSFFNGKNYYEDAGFFAKINNETRLPHYEAPCNRLAGVSDGKKFGNNIDPKQRLYFYNKLLCRSVPLVPSGPPTISSQGIPCVPYTFSDEAVDNGQLNPENKCFCVNKKCLPYGLMDVSNCFLGFSFGLSFPHFYKGDPSLMYNLEGIHPNASLHSSEVLLNLEVGALTSASIKLQGNLFTGDLSDSECCSRFSNMTIPVGWTEFEYYALERWIAFRIFLGLRVFPVVEKVFAAVTFLVGLYFIFKTSLANKIKNPKYSLRSYKNKPTEINPNSPFDVEADKQLKTLLSTDDRETKN